MATLTVWKFDSPESATGVESSLLDLQKQD